MKAPMDVGLDRQDGIGDEGMFDLGMVDGKTGRLGKDMDDEGEESEAEEEDEEEETEDEEQRRLDELEAGMDDMYDDFQNRRLEKDTKARVKAARAKRAAEEGGPWQGIQDEEESEEESDEEVAPVEDDEDTSDSEDDDDALDTDAAAVAAERKKGRKGLLTDLAKPKDRSSEAKNREAALWFDQPVFKGVAGLDALLQGEDEDDEDDDDEEEDDDFEDETDASDEEADVTLTEVDEDEDMDEVRPLFCD
jgi:AdoMet-dependent rRNA methyltransferase SPB1